MAAGWAALVLLQFTFNAIVNADPRRPVRFFTMLTTGPLKGAMLQFFADSTNFTRR